MNNTYQRLRIQAKEWCYPLTVFFTVWVVLWGWMLSIRKIIPVDVSPDAILRPYLGVEPEASSWLEIWQRWDVLHYQAIAANGYQAFETSLFTPPLYPALMRLLSLCFGGNTLLSGLLLSAFFCACSFVSFHRLAKFELKDLRLANQALLYLAIFPTSFFLFAPYTESLFLLGSVSCLLGIRQNRWLAAGIWGMFSACSRLTGAIMLIPITWAAWQHWKKTQDKRIWVAPILTLVAAASFPLYTWLGLGKSIMAPFEAQSFRFHGGFTFPGVNIFAAIQQIMSGNNLLTNFLDLFFIIAFLICGFLVCKQLPSLYGVYYLGFMLLYLTRIANVYPLLSMMRYVLALFPAFLVIARWQNPNIRRIIIYLFLLGLLFFSAQFSIWGWVG